MLATPELVREAALPGRLGELLPRWLREVPLYQQTHAAALSDGAASLPAELSRLPLITKQDIRRNFPHNFLRPGEELETLLEDDRVELEHTSGTSEERIGLLLGRGWWPEQERRALRLNSLVASVLEEFPQARRVTISSPVCSGDICFTGVPSRQERIVGDALFVSLSRFPFLWSEAELARMAAEAVQWQPQFLDVDPVYGVAFALYCERRGIELPSLHFVLCSYEFVSVVHRRILQRVFGVPVFDLYGSTETGHLLMEDERGQMRPSGQTAFLEVLSPDRENVGELVVTTLTNEFMPLIRYRIGDLVERREGPYRTTYLVHGRSADAFHGANGRRVTSRQIDQCLVDLAGMAHYQLLARPGGKCCLRFVPDQRPPDAKSLRTVQERLGTLLGRPEGIALEQTELLMPESSGKFRLGYPSPSPGGPLSAGY